MNFYLCMLSLKDKDIYRKGILDLHRQGDYGKRACSREEFVSIAHQVLFEIAEKEIFIFDKGKGSPTNGLFDDALVYQELERAARRGVLIDIVTGWKSGEGEKERKRLAEFRTLNEKVSYLEIPQNHELMGKDLDNFAIIDRKNYRWAKNSGKSGVYINDSITPVGLIDLFNNVRARIVYPDMKIR